MNDRIESETIQRILRQRAALARFGSYAQHEANLHKTLTEAARLCAEGLRVHRRKSGFADSVASGERSVRKSA